MVECEHQWQQDPENVMFMDCVKCSAILRVKDFCRKCQGRGWFNSVTDDEWQNPIRVSCSECRGLRVVDVPPRII
jgi:hypothetical protein